jgi:hypothetical protein
MGIRALVEPDVAERLRHIVVHGVSRLRLLDLGKSGAGGRVPEPVKLVGLGVGERFQQNGLNETEDRRVGADSEGQGEDDDGAESGAPPELPPDVTELFLDWDHGGPPPSSNAFGGS